MKTAALLSGGPCFTKCFFIDGGEVLSQSRWLILQVQDLVWWFSWSATGLMRQRHLPGVQAVEWSCFCLSCLSHCPCLYSYDKTESKLPTFSVVICLHWFSPQMSDFFCSSLSICLSVLQKKAGQMTNFPSAHLTQVVPIMTAAAQGDSGCWEHRHPFYSGVESCPRKDCEIMVVTVLRELGVVLCMVAHQILELRGLRKDHSDSNASPGYVVSSCPQEKKQIKAHG